MLYTALRREGWLCFPKGLIAFPNHLRGRHARLHLDKFLGRCKRHPQADPRSTDSRRTIAQHWSIFQVFIPAYGFLIFNTRTVSQHLSNHRRESRLSVVDRDLNILCLCHHQGSPFTASSAYQELAGNSTSGSAFRNTSELTLDSGDRFE